ARCAGDRDGVKTLHFPAMPHGMPRGSLSELLQSVSESAGSSSTALETCRKVLQRVPSVIPTVFADESSEVFGERDRLVIAGEFEAISDSLLWLHAESGQCD
ncbi:MAG TPA: hypothetical protein VIO38_13580, partial [Rariglobus sp.]